MSDETQESYIRQLLASHHSVPEVNIAWQGGEPTLMGLDFFRQAVELAERCKQPGQQLLHTMQTNGTKLDDEWCAMFKEHNFLIGLSMDGTPEMHDAYRVDKGGKGTFQQVLRGWEYLQKHSVDTNILTTVHAANADHPLELYRFFRDDLGAEFMQFIPILERATVETLPMADIGLGRHRRRAPTAVRATGQPGHKTIGGSQAVRAVPDRHFRGVGARGYRQGLCADV